MIDTSFTPRVIAAEGTISFGASVARGRHLPFRIVSICTIVPAVMQAGYKGIDLSQNNSPGQNIAGIVLALFVALSLLLGQ